MFEPARVLQPIQEAEPAIRALTEYSGRAEMIDAITSVWPALERSLRLLLRADPRQPDDVRLSALAPTEMSLDRVLEQLRAHETISIELAGMVHELRQTVERVGRGDARADDADLARRTVERLQEEVRSPEEPRMLDAARHAAEARVLGEHAHTVPPPRATRGGWRAALVIGVAAAAVITAILLIPRDDPMADAIEAFEADRMAIAELRFQEVVERDPDNVTALLYLGRIYRRAGRFPEAASALESAAKAAPNDPAVRRELGYLFLDLERPQAAADQFRRALNQEPDATLNWVGLIRALKAAGDPAAADLLRRAPSEVRRLFPDADTSISPADTAAR